MANGQVKVKINTNILNALKNSYGKGSQLQTLIDTEVVRMSDKYAPSDTTALRKSAYLNTDFGSGQVIYTIYGNPQGKNTYTDQTSHFQDEPTRGSRWVERMLDAGGRDKLLEIIRRFTGKG